MGRKSADVSRAGLLDYERKLERVVRAPGRKVMLLLAGPWSYTATRDALTPTAPYEELHDLRRGHRILDPIFETANRVGYTLYPIDVPGPPAPDADAAERGFPARQSVFREDEVHSTFFRLAGKTGGRALLDGWRRNAFDRVMEDTRSYYWLGFTPDWNGDNQSYDVQIELRRPGLEVRHRTELRDLSRSLEISYLVESGLLLGGVPGARPLPIQFGEAVKAGFRKLEVPLRIAIPMDAVTMLRRGGRYAADLELRVAVLDEGGNCNELAVLPVKLDGERPPAAGEYAVYPASGTILSCVARWTP